MKKRATLILDESRKRQELLDQLIQTVENFKDPDSGDDFDYATKAAIMDEVVDSINNFRAIEQQLFTMLGKSYTNTTYTAFDYIVKLPVPQFTDMRAIQMYYTNKLALLIAEMTLEEVETQFVDDGLGQGTNVTTNPPSPNPKPKGNDANIVYDKDNDPVTPAWNDAENAILASLATINSTLVGDVPNVS